MLNRLVKKQMLIEMVTMYLDGMKTIESILSFQHLLIDCILVNIEWFEIRQKEDHSPFCSKHVVGTSEVVYHGNSKQASMYQ